MDIRKFNQEAWDRQVSNGQNPWTIPVSPEIVAKARHGEWSVLLTQNISVGMERLQQEDRPAKFSHSLTKQLAGQMDAGFHLIGMYEDYPTGAKIADFSPTYLATRAVKP